MLCSKCSSKLIWTTDIHDFKKYLIGKCRSCGKSSSVTLRLNEKEKPISGRIVLEFGADGIQSLVKLIELSTKEETSLEDNILLILGSFANNELVFVEKEES